MYSNLLDIQTLEKLFALKMGVKAAIVSAVEEKARSYLKGGQRRGSDPGRQPVICLLRLCEANQCVVLFITD